MSVAMQQRIDCDVHCVPTRHDLSPYLSAQWREHFENTPHQEPAAVAMTYPGWHRGLRTVSAELPLERLQREVLADVRTAILQCYYGVECFTHPYLAAEMASAVNRWLAQEWLERDERLLGTAVVTPQYPERAVREIDRIADDRRFVQLLLPARATAGYGHQQYWPILRAAAERELAVVISFGGGTGTAPTPVNWPGNYYEEYNAAALAFESHVITLVMGGVFAELPQLRIVMSEGGWSWLPALMWRMDQEWKAVQREVPWVTEPPSAIVRRHFRFTTQPFDAPPNAAQLSQLLEHLGSDDLLMFGSDYPHRYPHGNEELLAALSDEQRERVLWRNASDWYGLDALVRAPA
jgi:predicted TIM-barrel fold metal-dependent hydrolase